MEDLMGKPNGRQTEHDGIVISERTPTLGGWVKEIAAQAKDNRHWVAG